MHTKISALSVVILLTSAVFSLPSGDGNEIRQQASSEELQDVERVSAKNPEQIHLAYTGEIDSMFVTWSTLLDAEKGSATFFSKGTSPKTVEASKTPLVHTDELNGKYLTRTTYTYRATMRPLLPHTTYTYFVRNGLRESESFNFTTFPNSTSEDPFLPRLTIYGDMGAVNHVSLAKIQQDLDKKNFDMIIHIGDFAYDMNGFLGGKGDLFMNEIQSVAARVPYNVAVGNHEHHNNFSEFAGRFTGPAPSVFYHSFNVGPLHIIMFSAEFYFFINFGTEQLQAQYNWIVEDLARANTKEAREAQPWIVAMAHRPMYCSSLSPLAACTKEDNPMRLGIESNSTRLYELEQLFLENGVDLQFYAHEHNYERLLPIYQYKYEQVANTSEYKDPIYPVQVITGSAGCREFRGFFRYPKPDWSVFRTNEYGFTRLKVKDRLTIQLEQYSIEQAKVVDKFTVSKSGNYPNFGVGKPDRF